MSRKLLFLTFFIAYLAPLHAQEEGKKAASYKYQDRIAYETSRFQHLGPLVIQIETKDTFDVTTGQHLPKPIVSKAIKGYLINNLADKQSVSTQDRSLIMIMQAQDTTGNWLPIEYWYWSDCLNSYVSDFDPLYLEKDEAVSFFIPIYEGEIETQLRLKLKRGTLNGGAFYYSPTFKGRVTKKQLYEVLNASKISPMNANIYLEH